MKSILCVMVLVISLLSNVFAGDKTLTFSVEKMTCALCPFTVSKAIEGVNGVTSVDVDYGSKTATVTFDDTVTDVDMIAAASSNAGYPAKLKKE